MNLAQEVFKWPKWYGVKPSPHALSEACGRTCVLDLERTWNRMVTLKLNDILNTALSHAHILTTARYANHTHAYKLVESIARDRDSLHVLVRTLEQEVSKILNRASKYSTITHALDCLLRLANMFNQVQKLDLWGNETLSDAHACCLDLVVSLVLLRARTKHRLPAREGILLARERMRRKFVWR
jgi:hypothetical protein